MLGLVVLFWFFLLGGGSGLIGDFGRVKGSRWGCDFSFVCLYFLQ